MAVVIALTTTVTVCFLLQNKPFPPHLAIENPKVFFTSGYFSLKASYEAGNCQSLACMSRLTNPVITTLFFLMVSLIASAQPDLSTELLEQARQYSNERQYDSAMILARKALATSTDSLIVAQARYELGRAQRRLNQFNQAILNLKYATSFIPDSLKAQVFYELGKCYSDLVQPDSSIFYYQQALSFEPTTQSLVRIYEGIANEYNYFYGNYTEAEIYYEKALRSLESLAERYEPLLLRLLYNLAVTHQQGEDYYAALDYAQRATKLAQETESSNLELCYSLLAIIYQELGQYSSAIEAYERAIKQGIVSGGEANPDLARYYNNLGLLYRENKDYKKAITYYRQAQVIAAANHYSMAQADLADSYQYLGNAYTILKDYTTAHYFLTQALNLKRSFFGDQHPEIANVYMGFAEYYRKQSRLDSALYFQQQALIAEIPGFSNESEAKNPAWEQLQDYTRGYNTLNDKAILFYQRYTQSDQSKDLELAISTFLLADSLMHTHRISYDYESSQLYLLESQKSVHETALASCYQMFDITQDTQYLRYALYFMERSKAVILWDVLREVTARSSLGVSDSLQREERTLKAQLTQVINEITEMRRQTDVDNSVMDSLQQKRFRLNRQQLRLQEKLRAAYPNYVQLKYASPSLPWNLIQQHLADEQQSMIEFFWGERHVYALRLSGDDIQSYRVEISDALIQSIVQLQKILQQGPSAERYLEETDQYLSSAYDIYQQFIAPAFSDEEPITPFLTIIPDGPLAYLPFDALLTEATSYNTEPDYRKLPYLLQKSAIQYSPSLQVLFNSQESDRSSNAYLRLIAFGFTDQSSRPQASTSRRLVALPGTYKEIRSIRRLTSAQLLAGAEASETRFKQDAESYQIIHLALHGLADSTNPNNNVLYFPADSDSANDGQLYSFELYDLELTNTKLAVLSACETGTGSWKAGEGVYSMGRGFAYAGCPSVIMSLWKVNDAFTAQIMPSLYQRLYRGNRIDQSLQQAKLRYIQKSNKYQAHPSFWAAFVLQGDFSPIVQYQSTYGAVLIIILISIAYFVFIAARKKRAGY